MEVSSGGMCVCACVRACVRVWVGECERVCARVRMKSLNMLRKKEHLSSLCSRVAKHKETHIHTCMHVHTRTHTHTYTHTRTHTGSPSHHSLKTALLACHKQKCNPKFTPMYPQANYPPTHMTVAQSHTCMRTRRQLSASATCSPK
jgi:hypothetical protein